MLKSFEHMYRQKSCRYVTHHPNFFGANHLQTKIFKNSINNSINIIHGQSRIVLLVIYHYLNGKKNILTTKKVISKTSVVF